MLIGERAREDMNGFYDKNDMGLNGELADNRQTILETLPYHRADRCS